MTLGNDDQHPWNCTQEILNHSYRTKVISRKVTEYWTRMFNIFDIFHFHFHFFSTINKFYLQWCFDSRYIIFDVN